MQTSSVDRFVHEGEVYTPHDRVHVTLVGNPFVTTPKVYSTPAGDTLADIILAAPIERKYMQYMQAYVEGYYIPRENWRLVRPKADTYVTLKAFPRGGGKSPLRIILSIVILIIAYYVPTLYPALSQTVVVGSLTVGGLITAGILIAGTLLLNALFPIPSPKLGSVGRDAPSFFLSGARNDLRPFQPIPKVLGRHLEIPPLGALPYTEVVGDDQYLRMIFIWGYGPLQIEDLRIGETPLEEFDEIEVEHVTGLPGDPTTFTLFSNSVYEESLSIKLQQVDDWVLRTSQADADEITVDVTFPQGLVEFNSDGSRKSVIIGFEVQYSVAGLNDWKGQSQTIASQVVTGLKPPLKESYIRYDYLFINSFTGNLFWWNGVQTIYEDVAGTWTGDNINITKDWAVKLARVQRRYGQNVTAAHIYNYPRTGDAPFNDPYNDFLVGPDSPISTDVTVAGGTLNQSGFLVIGKSTSAVRQAHRIVPDSRNQYDVRIRRTSPDATESFQGIKDSYWTALRTITKEDPVNFRGLTATALRIKATDRLNGIVDRFNGIAGCIIPDWDTTTQSWLLRHTRNPASCFLEALRGPGNARPLPYENLAKYSEQLGNTTVWSTFDSTVLDDQANDSTGKPTLEKVVEGTGLGVTHKVEQSVQVESGVQYCFAVETRAAERDKVRLDIGGAFFNDPHVYYDLRLGEVHSVFFTPDQYDIYDLGDGVYLCWLTATATGTGTTTISWYLANDSWTSVYDGDGVSGAYVGRVQFLKAEFPTPYQKTLDTPYEADARINMTDLQNWHEFCDANGFEFNMVRDFSASVTDVLKDIASAGRATPAIIDGKWSVVYDEQQTVPVQHFGPRNIRNFQGSKLFPDLPHAFRVIFLNENERWDEDERMVYDDGYDETNATKIERLELIGITDPDQIWKMGRYHIAQARLRPEEYTFETDLEYLACQRGNLIHVTHDTPLWGIGTARVITVNDNGSNVLSIVTDDALPVELAKSYSARFRASDGTTILLGVSVTPDANGLTDTFIFTDPPVIGVGTAPEVGDLMLFGEVGTESVELLVKAIRPKGDLSAEVICVDHSPGIYNADQGSIPPFNSNITPAAGTVVPSIIGADSDEDHLLILPDGSWQTRIVLTLGFTGQRPTQALSIQARYRITGTSGAYTIQDFPITSSIIYLDKVFDGETYDIQLRYLYSTDTSDAGPWGSVLVHYVVGATNPPPDVPTLLRSRDVITWHYSNPPPDFAGFKVKHQVGTTISWGNATELHKGLITETHFSIAPILMYGGAQVVAVKAVDVAGNESVNEAKLVLGLGDALIDNIIYTKDLDAAGFPGTYVNCSVVGGVLRPDSDGGLYLPTGSASYLPVGSDPYLPISYLDAEWYTQVYTLPEYYPGNVLFAITAQGQWYVEYRISTDSIAYINDEPDTNTYLPIGTDPYLPGWDFSAAPDYIPWPGRLTLENTTPIGIDLKVVMPGGDISANISNFDVLFDVDDWVEYIEDLALSAAGTRVPITKTYRSIKAVSVTLQDDAGSAESIKVLDKDATLGPLLKAFDDTQTATTALVDVVVTGVKG